MVERTCLVCGAKFMAYSRNFKYCNPNCAKIGYHRKKHEYRKANRERLNAEERERQRRYRETNKQADCKPIPKEPNVVYGIKPDTEKYKLPTTFHYCPKETKGYNKRRAELEAMTGTTISIGPGNNVKPGEIWSGAYKRFDHMPNY